MKNVLTCCWPSFLVYASRQPVLPMMTMMTIGMRITARESLPFAWIYFTTMTASLSWSPVKRSRTGFRTPFLVLTPWWPWGPMVPRSRCRAADHLTRHLRHGAVPQLHHGRSWYLTESVQRNTWKCRIPHPAGRHPRRDRAICPNCRYQLWILSIGYRLAGKRWRQRDNSGYSGDWSNTRWRIKQQFDELKFWAVSLTMGFLFVWSWKDHSDPGR